MKSLSANNIKLVLWDFDGVLMDSNAVRDMGFEKVLAEYPKEQVDKLLAYHRINGGLSRYVKFRYFLEEVLGQQATEEQIQMMASSFSVIMKELLTNPQLLINETVAFVQNCFGKVPMHIVSGSDGNELRYLSEQLGISKYFQSINGSPTPKKELVKTVLAAHSDVPLDAIVLIGDSINDYDAAKANNILFSSYNNPSLDKLSDIQIDYKDFADA